MIHIDHMMFYIGNTAGRVGAPVVIGSAVGGALILVLILLSLMVMLAVFIINRRKRINHEKLPGIYIHLIGYGGRFQLPHAFSVGVLWHRLYYGYNMLQD